MRLDFFRRVLIRFAESVDGRSGIFTIYRESPRLQRPLGAKLIRARQK